MFGEEGSDAGCSLNRRQETICKKRNVEKKR